MSVDGSMPAGLEDAQEEIRQLRVAVKHRTAIGQAQGILMERYEVDAKAAVAILQRASNNLNLKLHEVADQLVENRRLPREVISGGSRQELG